MKKKENAQKVKPTSVNIRQERAAERQKRTCINIHKHTFILMLFHHNKEEQMFSFEKINCSHISLSYF